MNLLAIYTFKKENDYLLFFGNSKGVTYSVWICETDMMLFCKEEDTLCIKKLPKKTEKANSFNKSMFIII